MPNTFKKHIMNNPINENIFSTTDLIEYRDYLESEFIDLVNDTFEKDYDNIEDATEFYEDNEGIEGVDNVDISTEFEELKQIIEFCEDLSYLEDYHHGETVIHEDEFTDYCKEMLEDCGMFPSDLPHWVVVDYDATADNMKGDYTEFSYGGFTYFAR